MSRLEMGPESILVRSGTIEVDYSSSDDEERDGQQDQGLQQANHTHLLGVPKKCRTSLLLGILYFVACLPFAFLLFKNRHDLIAANPQRVDYSPSASDCEWTPALNYSDPNNKVGAVDAQVIFLRLSLVLRVVVTIGISVFYVAPRLFLNKYSTFGSPIVLPIGGYASSPPLRDDKPRLVIMVIFAVLWGISDMMQGAIVSNRENAAYAFANYDVHTPAGILTVLTLLVVQIMFYKAIILGSAYEYRRGNRQRFNVWRIVVASVALLFSVAIIGMIMWIIRNINVPSGNAGFSSMEWTMGAIFTLMYILAAVLITSL